MSQLPRTLFDHGVTVMPGSENDLETIVLHNGEKRRPLPYGIRRGTFALPDGTRIPYYTAIAEDEKAVIVGCSGFKNDFPLTFRNIAKLKSEGYSLVWMAFPNPQRNLGFFDHFRQAEEMFLLDPPEHIREILDTTSPKIFLGQSTGSLLYLMLSQRPDAIPRLKQSFCGAVLSAPFIESANSSRRHDPVKSVLFDKFIARYSDKLPFETLPGRTYLQANNYKCDPRAGFDYTIPTLGQCGELMKQGRAYADIVYNAKVGTFRPEIPTAFFLGRNDPYACPKTARDIGEKIGAAIFSSDTQHSPISECADTFQLFLETARDMTEGSFLTPEPRELSQRPASTLNTLTGFFQGFGGRRIGNAEMRGEPESGAVHASHAFRLQ